MDRTRKSSRAIARLTGSACVAWLIAAAGAGQGVAYAQSGAPAKAATKAVPGTKAGRPAASPTAAPKPFADSPAASSADVKVSEHLTVDLHVQDEDLANVLQMLSLQSQRNIVVSKDVSATVSANLYNVTFYEALDAILNVNGYGYLERGNFIFVYTLAELAQIEQANRKPVSKVVRLNYLNANDAAEFVAPLLSEIGQIKTNGDVDNFSLSEKTPKGDEQFAMVATLVIYDYPEHVEEIEKLVGQLDTRPSQVLVEATILQTSLNEANAFGIDFSIIGDVNFTDFIGTGGPLSVANALVNGGDGDDGFTPPDNRATGITSTVGNTQNPRSTLKVGVISDDVSVFLRLLDEVTDVSILSNPKVLTLNRQPARVLVGQRLGYVNTTVTETASIPKVEFLNTGVQLAFRPFISTDGMIRMELTPSVSTGQVRTVVGQQGAPLTIPDEDARELSTNVIVRDGNTIVLGGLFSEQTTLNRRQIPVLGDVPIVGAAFRGHDDETKRSEVIFMVKPTIVNDQSLLEQGDRALAYAERVRVGARSGLLPFSRDKMTAQLNVEAEKLAASGDSEGALWKVRRSLELNHLQPDAIRLRERLMNQRETWPSRSLLDRVVGDEAEKRVETYKPVSAAPRKSDAGQASKSGSTPAQRDGALLIGSPNDLRLSVAVLPGESGTRPTGTQAGGLTKSDQNEIAFARSIADGKPFDLGEMLVRQREAAAWAMPFFTGDISMLALSNDISSDPLARKLPVVNWFNLINGFPEYPAFHQSLTGVTDTSTGYDQK